MIQKIEIKEEFNNSLIIIDVANKKVLQMMNNNILKDDNLNIDVNELIELVNSYVIYYDNEYINNNIVGGKIVKFTIYTNDETIEYNFKNKFPYNYNEFITTLKQKVGILYV